MTSLTNAKKWLSVINNAINYPLFVLTTSPLLFFILIFQMNYCGGDFLFFFSYCRSFFQQRRWSTMDGLREPVSARDWSSKRLGGTGLEETLPNCLQHVVLYNVFFFILTIFSFPVFHFVRHFCLSFSNNFYCDIIHLYNIVIPIIKLIQ